MNKNKGKYTLEHQENPNNLKLKFFKLPVLDRYKQDPRYNLSEHPVSMNLEIKDECYNDPKIPESDKIGIQSLGYAYRKRDNSKVIVTYLPYLARLSEEHQNYWASFEENEECILDEDFFNQEFNAEFTERVNIFDAFIQELIEINKLCKLMNEPNFFNNTYEKNKPVNFGWITKPTYQCYYELVHLIDKLVSENINKEFFKGKIGLQEEIPYTNNKLKVVEKGTIRLLSEWLDAKLKFPDPKLKDEMLNMFKKIRKERQKPAHSITDNSYDVNYFDLQKELVVESYRSIRTLRLIFVNHPLTQGYRPPEWLQKGKIM